MGLLAGLASAVIVGASVVPAQANEPLGVEDAVEVLQAVVPEVANEVVADEAAGVPGPQQKSVATMSL